MIFKKKLIVEENINTAEVFPNKELGFLYLFSKKYTLRVSMVNEEFLDFEYDRLDMAISDLKQIEAIRLS